MAKRNEFKVFLQEFPDLRRQLWGRHVWARGYLAVSSGTITDEMIKQYIAEQGGEPIQDESQFVIDEDTKPLPSRRSRSPLQVVVNRRATTFYSF